jgi:hypothetical protein
MALTDQSSSDAAAVQARTVVRRLARNARRMTAGRVGFLDPWNHKSIVNLQAAYAEMARRLGKAAYLFLGKHVSDFGV